MKSIKNDSFIKLIIRYSIILIILQIIHQLWFYAHYRIGGAAMLDTNIMGQINWITIQSLSNYLVNIIFAIIIYFDLKKFQIKSVLLPLITLLFGYFGIYFSILIILYKIYKDKIIKASES